MYDGNLDGYWDKETVIQIKAQVSNFGNRTCHKHRIFSSSEKRLQTINNCNHKFGLYVIVVAICINHRTQSSLLGKHEKKLDY